MTMRMPDSVSVADLPSGYAAYLGYVDGQWPTARELVRAFPGRRYVLLTVTGATLAADGCDIEPRNMTAEDGARWARQKLGRDPGSRPVLYASVTGEPGYGMGDVVAALAANKVGRDQVRLLSAHWNGAEHICGPGSCRASGTVVDGTQWTDSFAVPGGWVDMSVLADGFFGSWTEEIMQQLPAVRQGDSGEAVRTVQGLCQARGNFAPPLVMDGVFGPKTKLAVTAVQGSARITVDGIVGPQTWPVLLGIA